MCVCVCAGYGYRKCCFSPYCQNRIRFKRPCVPLERSGGEDRRHMNSIWNFFPFFPTALSTNHIYFTVAHKCVLHHKIVYLLKRAMVLKSIDEISDCRRHISYLGQPIPTIAARLNCVRSIDIESKRLRCLTDSISVSVSTETDKHTATIRWWNSMPLHNSDV